MCKEGGGHIGATLTRRFTALGHQVSVANSRGPETIADLAVETGATAVTASEAARGNDLVVVTIPEVRVPQIPADLFADTPGRIALPVAGDDDAAKGVPLRLVDLADRLPSEPDSRATRQRRRSRLSAFS